MTAFHRTDGPAGKMPMLADHLEILGMTKQADDLRKFIADHARLSALVEGQGRALAELDDAMLDVRDAFIRDGTYSGKKGAAIKRMNAAITQARAARPSKGADND